MSQYIKCIDCILSRVNSLGGPRADVTEQVFSTQMEEAERRANIAVTTISGNPVCLEHLTKRVRHPYNYPKG